MASIEARESKRKDGTVRIGYRVSWRRHREKESATFADEDQAKQAKSLVEGLRNDVDPDTVYRRVYGLPDPEPAPPKVKTWGEWAAQWWPTKTGVQEDTVEVYRRNWELHVAEIVVGGMRLQDYPIDLVTPAVLADWVRIVSTGPQCEYCGAGTGDPCAKTCERLDPDFAGRRRGMHPATVHRCHAVIHQLLRDAAREPSIPLTSNPASHTRLPREDAERDDEEHTYLTKEEAQLLLAQMNSPLARAVVVFLLGTGLRWSEMSALQGRDVDLLAPVPHIRIQRAWKHSRRRGWYLGPPKSKRSRRKVTISPEVVEILAARVDLLDDEKFVFTNTVGKRLDNDNFRVAHWDPAVLAANGLEIVGRKAAKQTAPAPVRRQPKTLLGKYPTPHDLRHTHASWLIQDGHEMVRISRRLGHASSSFTERIYVHLSRDHDKDLLDDLDKALKPPQVVASKKARAKK